MNQDFLGIRKEMETGGKTLSFFSLRALEEQGYDLRSLPFSIRVLLENALRNFDGYKFQEEHVRKILQWKPGDKKGEIPFLPGRVLMQDFTGVPAIVDIASLRSELERQGKDPSRINPVIPVDLVVDHSVQVDDFGSRFSFARNVEKEYERNGERYRLLKWARGAFKNLSVVPPGMGICHQVNLEFFSQCVLEREGVLFPDSLVGTDSHTPMVNALGILAYGVGGIEAEAALLGQPQFFALPEVVGLKLTGKLPAGTTATDLVLTITKFLRETKVVGQFVEVFGDGLNYLSVPDRATISNMSPEFGCTVTYFPVDDKTLDYLEKTNRSEEVLERTRKYTKENLLWRESEDRIQYSRVVELDLSTVEATLSGPARPQDRILLREARENVKNILWKSYGRSDTGPDEQSKQRWTGEGGKATPTPATGEKKEHYHGEEVEYGGQDFQLRDGAVVIAAITSCTNTSNPDVMLGAGILARKAREKGLSVKPWVKTSLAPGSKVVTDYLKESGYLEDLEKLNFHLVGYGCTSCIGNSGPLPEPVARAIDDKDLIVASVLSGNRNFEARIHPRVRMNFLMSPILVVAFAIAGQVDIDLTREPLGKDPEGRDVFLEDLWPDAAEIEKAAGQVLKKEFFEKNYGEIFEGNRAWQDLEAPEGRAYVWDPSSTYVKEPPFFRNLPENPPPITPVENARVLLLLGDTVTTDHISPAGSFPEDSPAGRYLLDRGVAKSDFNSYGSRRGNDEIMVRGTFANVRIKNRLVDREGGYTTHFPSGREMTVFEASRKYREEGTPLIVLAGKEYGTGSSRDWAAKGTFLLGVRAVLAESYERIHRSNLVGMGVLPLQFQEGESADSLGLRGDEFFSFPGLNDGIRPGEMLEGEARGAEGRVTRFIAVARLDNEVELEYYRNGGILHYVFRQFQRES